MEKKTAKAKRKETGYASFLIYSFLLYVAILVVDEHFECQVTVLRSLCHGQKISQRISQKAFHKRCHKSCHKKDFTM
jgi:hypothetical protein